MKFGDVVGNTDVKYFLQNKELLNMVKFVILYGPLGHGKSTLSECTAAYILCENPDTVLKEPCLECESCKMVAEGRNTDTYLTINVGLNNDKHFAEYVNEQLSKITEGRGVILLQEIHGLMSMTDAALLDMFDKMGKDKIIIGTTTHLHKLSSPLRSRALKLEVSLSSLETNLMMEILAKDNNVSPDIVKFLKHRHISPREITDLFNQLKVLGSNDLAVVKKLMDYVPEYKILELANAFFASPQDFAKFVTVYSPHELTKVARSAVIEITRAITKIDFDAGVKKEDYSLTIKNFLTTMPIEEQYRLLNYLVKLSKAQDPTLDAMAIRYEYTQSKFHDEHIESFQLWRQTNRDSFGLTAEPLVETKKKKSNSEIDMNNPETVEAAKRLELSTQFNQFGGGSIVKR